MLHIYTMNTIKYAYNYKYYITVKFLRQHSFFQSFSRRHSKFCNSLVLWSSTRGGKCICACKIDSFKRVALPHEGRSVVLVNQLVNQNYVVCCIYF